MSRDFLKFPVTVTFNTTPQESKTSYSDLSESLVKMTVCSAMHDHPHLLTSVRPLFRRDVGHCVPLQHHHPLLSSQEGFITIPPVLSVSESR